MNVTVMLITTMTVGAQHHDSGLQGDKPEDEVHPRRRERGNAGHHVRQFLHGARGRHISVGHRGGIRERIQKQGQFRLADREELHEDAESAGQDKRQHGRKLSGKIEMIGAMMEALAAHDNCGN